MDSFNYNWERDVNWLVPPVNLISKCIKHMEKCSAVGMLIVPKWQAAEFCPLLCNPDGSYKLYIIDSIEYVRPTSRIFMAAVTLIQCFLIYLNPMCSFSDSIVITTNCNSREVVVKWRNPIKYPVDIYSYYFAGAEATIELFWAWARQVAACGSAESSSSRTRACDVLQGCKYQS